MTRSVPKGVDLGDFIKSEAEPVIVPFGTLQGLPVPENKPFQGPEALVTFHPHPGLSLPRALQPDLTGHPQELESQAFTLPAPLPRPSPHAAGSCLSEALVNRGLLLGLPCPCPCPTPRFCRFILVFVLFSSLDSKFHEFSDETCLPAPVTRQELKTDF